MENVVGCTNLQNCINLAFMATPRTKMHMEDALAVENLSKIGQILLVFDENKLLLWSLTSTHYEIN